MAAGTTSSTSAGARREASAGAPRGLPHPGRGRGSYGHRDQNRRRGHPRPRRPAHRRRVPRPLAGGQGRCWTAPHHRAVIPAAHPRPPQAPARAPAVARPPTEPRRCAPTHRRAGKAGQAGPRAGQRPPRARHPAQRPLLAQRQQLVAFNAAANLDLPAAARPKVRPWEPAELGRFLDSLGGDRLAALFELIAATGLRRGEACGLRWSDVDLGRGVLVVRQQLVQVSVPDERAPKCTSCGEVHKGHAFGLPKTSSGEARAVELDGGTVGVLLAHRLTQDAERLGVGDRLRRPRPGVRSRGWQPATARSRHQAVPTSCAVAAGLRPIRLHDLRHGAASLMLAAGVDLALVSKRLGHSSVSITSDTYSHLVEGVGREAAERAAALVPRNRGDQPVTNPAEIGVGRV